MLTLKAEKRNPDEKAKKLRRDGFITGVLYGKEMKENVSLKFTEKDASAFIKNAKEGTQAYLELDGKNVDVLVKNIDFDPLTKKYMALDFQALVAGEIVSATVPIVYVKTRYRVSSKQNCPRCITKQIPHICWSPLKLIWPLCPRLRRPCMSRI